MNPRISQTFDELTEALACAAADPKKKTVHHLRTNTRRLESMIKNLLPSGSEKKLASELKKIRRAAGAVRDVDVQSKLVDEFGSPESARSQAFVRAKLDLMRARSEKKLIQLLAPEELKDLQVKLDQCRRKLLASARHTDQPDPLTRALEQYSRLLGQFEPLNEGNLHEFRKSCKHARYLAELALESPRKKTAIEALTRIQDSIGAWHDILTLIDVAEDALKSPKASPFIGQLRGAAQKKLQESLAACQNANEELLRVEVGQPAAQRKRPHRATSERGAQSRAAA